MSVESEEIRPERLRDTVHETIEGISKKVIGSRRVARFMFIALLSGNHILLEGVPGLAKTMLASEFARRLCMDFKRIQFTPDMLPSDITGSLVFNLEARQMEFRKGPVFANVLLADEINRTPPKVQSALLEAMEEKHVSVGGQIHPVPEPFFVIATQNPIEQEGTFPLAEALLDRFLFRYILTYPSREEEVQILRSLTLQEEDEAGLDAQKILAIRSMVKGVYASEEIMNYIVDIIRATRSHEMVFVGASPRTTAKYLMAAKANAMLSGREYVIPEDVRFMAKEMLNHRIVLKPEVLVDSDSDPYAPVMRTIESIISGVESPV